MEDNEKNFYLATRGEDGVMEVYQSDKFFFAELEIINLIKICLIEERSKIIGRKIMQIYKDATEHRKDLTLERLKKIGIKEDEKQKPTREKKIRKK